MNKSKQLFLIFALLAMFVAPFQASAQLRIVSAGTAMRVSGQNDDFFKDTANCSVIKVVNSDDEDVQSLDIQPEHQDLPLVRFTKNLTFGAAITYYACTIEAFAIIQTTYNPGILNSISDTLVSFFKYFIELVNGLLTWVLKWAGYLLIAMIGQGKFITSDIVTQAWPFVQGLANLGFIFALLYIALATTLRLESVSSSIQRLLPRLLVAALLVNFSLVIGGLIIDASRLLMAAEISIMGGGSLDYENFTAELVRSSNASATILSGLPLVDTSNASAVVLKMIQSVVFLGLLTAAIFVIAINLFIRYIALLILLILSPIAYLALALPKTSQYATQWWGMFIKWVLYGPIVLFFLIIITRIQNVDIVLADTVSENKLFTVFFNQFIHFAIVIALFFVANSVGKKVAGAGSDAVMGFAQKNPRAAFIAGTSLLTGGLGGAAAVALSSRSARDAYSGVGKGLATKTRAGELFGTGGVRGGFSTAAKWALGAERNEKGELKDGEKSIGSRLVDKITPLKLQAAVAASKEAERIANLPDPNEAGIALPERVRRTRAIRTAYDTAAAPGGSLDPTKLLKGKIAAEISPNALDKLVRNSKNDSMIDNILGHKDVVVNMKNETKAYILANGKPRDPRKAKENRASKLEGKLRDIGRDKK
ncbi:MAG: hypothetical protein O3A36_00315 [bacterium]|nr:hypothetical protein [bacterium]